MLKAEAAGSPKGRAVAQVVPGKGGGEGGCDGEGAVPARNTGSHCREQATPRTGSCIFELGGKVGTVRARVKWATSPTPAWSSPEP